MDGTGSVCSAVGLRSFTWLRRGLDLLLSPRCCTYPMPRTHHAAPLPPHTFNSRPRPHYTHTHTPRFTLLPDAATFPNCVDLYPVPSFAGQRLNGRAFALGTFTAPHARRALLCCIRCEHAARDAFCHFGCGTFHAFYGCVPLPHVAYAHTHTHAPHAFHRHYAHDIPLLLPSVCLTTHILHNPIPLCPPTLPTAQHLCLVWPHTTCPHLPPSPLP